MAQHDISSSNKKYTYLVRIALVGFVIAGALLGVFFLEKPSTIPESILKQVNFVIFYPNPSGQTMIERNTIKYDKSLEQVSFIVDFGGRSITFAEQSSPDSFAADPNFYPEFIEKLGGYVTFNSVSGRVDLTRPAQVNAETGVMNARGTLLFAKSNGNLNENNWKLLFNSFSYTQPN
jgi:hypothetical protein